MWKNIHVGKMLTCLTKSFVFNNTPGDYLVTTLRTEVFSNINWAEVRGNTCNVDIPVICTQLSYCERSTWTSLAHALDTIDIFVHDDLKSTFFWEEVLVTFKPRLRFHEPLEQHYEQLLKELNLEQKDLRQYEVFFPLQCKIWAYILKTMDTTANFLEAIFRNVRIQKYKDYYIY